MTMTAQKQVLLLGFHNHLPYSIQKNKHSNDLNENYITPIINLIDFLGDANQIKLALHLSGNLISYLDKKYSDFSPKIRTLLDRNQLELLSGGIYEPIFSFTPKEDRQTQLQLMNRLLNHTYGYTPHGAWVTEYSWEPSFALDLAKSRIQYTCLPKEYFIFAGLEESDISGYYLTEEEGRKLAVFPISYELNSMIGKYSPEETVNNLLSKRSDDQTENPPIVLFHKDEIDANKFEWFKKFFEYLYKKSDLIETKLFGEYFHTSRPKGRIYLPTIHDLSSSNLSKHWKSFLLKYHEINLLHKKMLRVSKKINSAKEGKSRFKVIKEMISQAQDLLLKGQCNDAYWDNNYGGIYLPTERHNTYTNLIKAENLIDAASKHGSKWIQVYELDYDCDGHDEIIVETETQNVYISPDFGGAILEHDFRPKNINITNTISRKKESYHQSNGKEPPSQNGSGNSIYDKSLKLNLMDHFLNKNCCLENIKTNNLEHLTKDIITPYQVEKIKAKEETFKVTFNKNIDLARLTGNPQIDFKKQISIRSGDSSLYVDYTLINKSPELIELAFAVEFNLNITPDSTENSYFYLDGNKNSKTPSPEIITSEEIKNINQISLINPQQGININFSWNKGCNLFRYPIETISYKSKKLENIYQGTTLLPSWNIQLEPDVPFELSIKQSITAVTDEM